MNWNMSKTLAAVVYRIARTSLLCGGLCVVSLGCGDSGPKVVMPEKPTPLPDESARFGSPSPSAEVGADTQALPPNEETQE